ncbi:hypothetical protein SAMN00777080_4755 [Aquiflexum balticum DSM 16537]|uniref:Uncharacterized protein n=1 Tax=Aquiflexum balticum DSM 16537 TaxID=758820 RepID=A0A1W2HBX3_9BACT|nr:hypothetical protein [Aquiflexum balticum]SMD46076.1 hypothetical protein SAMN00777080_4755 [Aquiflexum balticum DSM 16537]
MESPKSPQSSESAKTIRMIGTPSGRAFGSAGQKRSKIKDLISFQLYFLSKGGMS